MAGSLQLQQFGLRGSESAGALLTQAGQGNLNRQEHSMDRLSREMMQMKELDAVNQRQQVQIDAQSQLQKQAADYAYKRAAVEAGLQEQVANREFDNRLREIQARAKAEAEQFDFEFSTENKAKMAHIQNYIQEAEQSGLYTPEQLGEIRRQGLGELAGIKKTAIPAKGQKMPEWAKPFGISVDPDSQIAGTFEERNGKLNFKPLPKEMQQSYQQYAMKLKEAESGVKRQEQMLEYINKPVKDEDGERPPTWEEQASRRRAWQNSMYFSDMLERKPEDGDGESNGGNDSPSTLGVLSSLVGGRLPREEFMSNDSGTRIRSDGKRQPKTRPPGKFDDVEQAIADKDTPRVKTIAEAKRLPRGYFFDPNGILRWKD